MGPVRSARVAVFLVVRSVLRSNYGIAATTALMMALIYINLLFMPSLIQGAVNRVNNRLIDTLTSNINITPTGNATSLEDVNAYLAKIRNTGGVAAATSVFRVGNQVSHGSYSGSFDVYAIDPNTYKHVFDTPNDIFDGSYLHQDANSQVFLGIGIAGANDPRIRGYRASLQHVTDGDTVDITLNDGRVEHLKVAGVYNDQFPLADKWAFISQHEASKLLPRSSDHATTIFVRTTSGANVNHVVGALRRIRGGTQFETSASLGTAVEDQTASFRLISNILKVVSLLVAAITIFIVTYVDLVNKRRQIGIERAIGIHSPAIVASYVLKALTYAIVGIIAGLLLFTLAITPLVTHHPFEFPNGPVALATSPHEIRADLIILLIVAAIAALVPALQSVRLRIIDAIWST